MKSLSLEPGRPGRFPSLHRWLIGRSPLRITQRWSLLQFGSAALFLDEDLRLEVALQRMQRAGQRLAIVLGRDRRETGILSLQDVLKVIFGEVSL